MNDKCLAAVTGVGLGPAMMLPAEILTGIYGECLLQCLNAIMLLFGTFDVLKHLMLWRSVIAAGKAAGTSNHGQYFYYTVLEDNKKCSERNTFRQ